MAMRKRFEKRSLHVVNEPHKNICNAAIKLKKLVMQEVYYCNSGAAKGALDVKFFS